MDTSQSGDSIESADAVYAILNMTSTTAEDGFIDPNSSIKEELQDAIRFNKPLYLYNESNDSWYKYLIKEDILERIETPDLENKFYGLTEKGTGDKGRDMVSHLFKTNLSRAERERFNNTQFESKETTAERIARLEAELGLDEDEDFDPEEFDDKCK